MRLLLLAVTLPSLWYAVARDAGTPICHRVNGRGNTGNGYNLLVVSDRQLERHRGHVGDLIPAPNGFCLILFPPTTPPAPPTTRPPTPTTLPPAPSTTRPLPPPTTRPPTVTTRPPTPPPTTRPSTATTSPPPFPGTSTTVLPGVLPPSY